ncbi:MAG: STAS domain-containing protein [Anaerolineales bacterium]|nr:STAS domain-containing protein [Anaerolineales bacterium]
MEITVTHEQNRVPVTVLHVAGKTDSESAAILQKKAMELIDGGARYLIFDLSRVPYMSSAGLRVLQEVFNKLRALSSEDSDKDTSEGSYQLPYLKIVNPTPEVLEVLKMSGFDMLVAIEHDLKKALASI